MVRSLISLSITVAIAALSAVDATNIAVLELGKGGVLHKTDASSTTSASGVVSFWRSAHDAGSDGKIRETRTVQNPGMNIVPDIFSRADGGVVIGITGEAANFDSMSTVASMFDGGNAIGNFEIPGENGRKLMRHINADSVASAEFSAVVDEKSKSAISEEGNKLESVMVSVDNKDAAASVDSTIARMLKSLSADAEKAGTTIVVHLVIDDEKTNAAHRRLVEERVLEDAAGDDQNANNNFKIPGYYDDNGNFVTSFKTIYQIQYFNVVLWTAVGLFGILVAANYMTMNMPLMPDTLLFGESAKMVAE